jgi:hypothetical protein
MVAGTKLAERSDMPDVKFVVTSSRAPLSTQFWEFCKGLEHCYYALVFTTDKSYDSDSNPWQDWVRMGFHLGIKSPPPSAKEGDVLRLDMRLDGKMFDVLATSSNRQGLEDLAQLLTMIERLRQSVQDESPEDRVKAIQVDPGISNRLIWPLEQALAGAGLYESDVESYHRAFRRAFAAFTDHELITIDVSSVSER